MSDERTRGYGAAILAAAQAEGDQAAVERDLAVVAQTLRTSAELRATLSDSAITPERRQAVLEEVLSRKARPATSGALSMVVAAGRGSELLEIIDAAIDQAAAQRNRSVARVRSAVDLTDDQQNRLADAIKSSTGLDVEISVIIDPSVLGGIITEIGDDVIDGSLRRRLNQMRSSVA